MKTTISIINRINQLVLVFIAVLFGVTAVLTILQVFSRYILNSPLIWSEALVRYIMIWIVLLGTAVALRRGLLISVEVILFLVPQRIKKVLQFLILIVNAIFLILLIVYGFRIMESLAGQTVGAISVPVTWVYASIPVGAILALINCVALFIELIAGKEEGERDDGPIIS